MIGSKLKPISLGPTPVLLAPEPGAALLINGAVFGSWDCCAGEGALGEFALRPLKGLCGVRIPDCVRPVTTARRPWRTKSGFMLLVGSPGNGQEFGVCQMKGNKYRYKDAKINNSEH